MTTGIRSDTSGTFGALTFGGDDVLRFGSDNSGQLAGFRNRIINGDFRVAQRGNTSIIKNAWTYGGADRMCVSAAEFTTLSGYISQYVDVGAYGRYAQGCIITTTGTGWVGFQQRIEAMNTRSLNSKTVTFSATVYHNTGSPLLAVLEIGKANTLDNFCGQTVITYGSEISIPNNVPTKLTVTITLGAQDASNGLCVTAIFPSVGAVTSKDFTVQNLQLEEGSIATPFEHRPIGLERNLCQRYFRVYATAQNTGDLAYDMRATPTSSGSGPYLYSSEL